MSSIISLSRVGKMYKLFDKPIDRVKEAFHPFKKKYHREFWALDDFNLEVRKGETIGFVGQNGSGKSTLLQIIAGILQPTRGQLQVHGRISALLELGAGFNPEFTGRDNVILNGAIQGIGHHEMLQRMPAIEEFADIGSFFDQPVKTYSSGMYVRVAFAVAIMIDPDILIIDEALAVGDARFQHKCYSKFEEFRRQNKTILFVSHSLQIISQLCDRAVLLESGKMIGEGNPKGIVDAYIKRVFDPGVNLAKSTVTEPAHESQGACGGIEEFMSEPHLERLLNRPSYNANETRLGDHRASIIDCLLMADGCVFENATKDFEELQVVFKVQFHATVEQPVFGLSLKLKDGIEIYATNSFMDQVFYPPAQTGETKIVFMSMNAKLLTGDYFLDLGVCDADGTTGGVPVDVRRSCIHFYIQSAEKFPRDGVVNLRAKYRVL